MCVGGYYILYTHAHSHFEENTLVTPLGGVPGSPSKILTEEYQELDCNWGLTLLGYLQVHRKYRFSTLKILVAVFGIWFLL